MNYETCGRPAKDPRETRERPAKDPRKKPTPSLPEGRGKRGATILRRYIAKRYRSPICEGGVLILYNK